MKVQKLKKKIWNKNDSEIFIPNLHCDHWICTFKLKKYQMHHEQSITKIVIQCISILHKILYMILNLIWKLNIKDI
jgi:hypothetical protein